MNRILFWVAVIGLGYLAWRLIEISQRKQQRRREQNESMAGRASPAQQRQSSSDPPASGPPPAQAQLQRGESMVRCARCGIYLPESESLERSGLVYCSEDHRRLGQVVTARDP